MRTLITGAVSVTLAAISIRSWTHSPVWRLSRFVTSNHARPHPHRNIGCSSTGSRYQSRPCSSPAPTEPTNTHLSPKAGLTYSPSYSADGAWIVFTTDRDGQADIYRVHPDGTGIQQLTNDPAFDDQGVFRQTERHWCLSQPVVGARRMSGRWDIGAKKFTNLTRQVVRKFQTNLVTERRVDRVHLGSGCRARSAPRAVGTPSVPGNLHHQTRRQRPSPADEERRRRGQSLMVC